MVHFTFAQRIFRFIEQNVANIIWDKTFKLKEEVELVGKVKNDNKEDMQIYQHCFHFRIGFYSIRCDRDSKRIRWCRK